MVTLLLAAIARATGSPEYLDDAERFGIAAFGHRQTVPDNHRRALICRAIAAVLRGDRARAADLYPQMIEAGIGERPPWLEICGFRALALIADFIGNGDEAFPHIERALEYCRGVGFRPELAWTCSDYAEMLLERNAPGDREKATELQDEAIAIAQELGMQPLLERVLAQREILKA